MSQERFSTLSQDDKDPLIRLLHKIIRFGVKALAVLMTMVIIWGILDVVWVIYQRLSQPPYLFAEDE